MKVEHILGKLLKIKSWGKNADSVKAVMSLERY